MKPEMRTKIIAFNKERAENKEMAEDFMILLSALPPGQVKNLMKDETCAAVLNKYGISNE